MVVLHLLSCWFMALAMTRYVDSTFKHLKHQAHMMDGIIIGRSPTSNALLLYNPHNKQYYETEAVSSTPTASLAKSTMTQNMMVVFSAPYIAMLILPWKNYILPVLESNASILRPTCSWPVQSWTFPFSTILPAPILPIFLLLIPSSLIMALPPPFLSTRWH